VGSTKKPRKKYKPGRVLRNPVGYVLESIEPVTKHSGFLTDLRIINSAAMTSLMQGTAKMLEVDRLVAMSNITEALQHFGFGVEYRDAAQDGRQALYNIIERAGKIKRFTPTGVEVRQLNMLMELHDAQLDVITVRDMELAIEYVEKQRPVSTRLPTVPEHLK
jgi:hypothetical protein